MFEVNNSVFQGDSPLKLKLERARMELLDLSARNRLLNIPKSKTAKHIDIIDERSEHIFRILVNESKTFTFLSGRDDVAEALAEGEPDEEFREILQQPEEDDETEDPLQPRSRHIDTKLQTRMTPKGLQKRLLDLYHDSRTLEEEQGVNILFLTLGAMKWIDPKNKENIRYAPLVLVPVSLERSSAGEKFRLKVRQEEYSSNLSLEAYLDREHTLKLPSFENEDDFDIVAYMSEVAKAIESKTDWEVQQNHITLGFFSFAKFLMYRDLDPENWPPEASLTEQPIIRALLADGFEISEPLISDDDFLDQHLSPKNMLHVVDSDSSQTLAVNEARSGRSIVIQGPPGTGKSQTIANVIASAVADGRTVLFVAEKMAALEVVKRRLDQAGVGDACLELHSNKANKKALLEELRRTWELGSPRGEFQEALMGELTSARDVLNEHSTRLHTPLTPSMLTPYQVMGQLVRLRNAGQYPTNISLEGAENWTEADFRMRSELIHEITQRIQDIGLPVEHPWYGVGLEMILPATIDRLRPMLSDLALRIKDLDDSILPLAQILELSASPELFTQIKGLKERAEIIAAAPSLSASALTSSVWNSHYVELQELISLGGSYQQQFSLLSPSLTPDSLDSSLEGLEPILNSLPSAFPISGFNVAREVAAALPRLREEAKRLQLELGASGDFETLSDIERLVAIGERVSHAPDASPDAFLATVWEHGVEQASELAEAIAELEEIKATSSENLLPVAWETEIRATRQILATHSGIFKVFSREWRQARALTRSIIRDPALPVSRMVELLDVLGRGQNAVAKIQSGNSFGLAAFGADWRSENSQSAPLLALVAWMRTLRGFGDEPRRFASQVADRSGVGARTLELQKQLTQITPQLSIFWNNYGSSIGEVFDHHVSFRRTPLSTLEQHSKTLEWADDLCINVLASPPKLLTERSELIQQLSDLQEQIKNIHSLNEIGEQGFGNVWEGHRSQWENLRNAQRWISQYSEYRHTAAKIMDRKDVADQASLMVEKSDQILAALDVLAQTLAAQPEVLFNAESAQRLNIQTTLKKLDLWLLHTEQLSKWVTYNQRAKKAQQLGLGLLVTQISDGELPQEQAKTTLDQAYYEGILNVMVSADPQLGRFDGDLHSSYVSTFTQLDRQRIKAASLEVVRAHHRRIPAKEGGTGPVGILRGEMARRRGHMPIRQLMLRAGSAIQALKPVMMMSPQSVAQFLVPGRQTFDLLVMDEASQIQPVDAIGAIARSRQVVVVGDERQLPPTKFFAKMTGSDPDENDETTQVADIESILGLFVARGLPQRMLRWHYRSRHQSLIAVSNSQFYENKLFIVPSPYTQEAGMGLQFHFVDGGVFDSGGTNTNKVEARAVAQAIMKHAISHPQNSLGVATFSVSQRKAIQDEVELLRRLNPETENFFSAHPSEPFFVKNLENVQGDERDVIMISVGYARNAQGYMAMRFGPLGADGGERRLNVLISRAKRRCEVFASITDEDIDLERAKGAGVIAFKLFLHYARTGRLGIAQASARPMDSIFEEQVANKLLEAGYQVHPQVGIAGFFIDLAIADPETPGRYLIGIECDGSTYHSSRSARDRDRLRQAVLEDHGWIIHRIWSTDWFQRPEEQLQRIINAIEAAKIELAARLEQGEQAQRAVPVEIITVDRGPVTEIGLIDVTVTAQTRQNYIEATPQSYPSYELHETPVGILAGLIEHIVTTESPIHIDEIITRLRTAWGLQRAGVRIEAAVEAATKVACSQGSLHRVGKFVFHTHSEPQIRDRHNVNSSNLRKSEMIAPEEIKVGIIEVVRTNLGATEDELATTIARMLGFKMTSGALKKVVTDVVASLITEGSLRRDDTMIVLNGGEA